MHQKPAANSLPDSRLDSWKAIAEYLRRDVSTVRRWEKHEGLPVHRHLHHKLGSVYAFRGEIDDWQARRRSAPAPPNDHHQVAQAEERPAAEDARQPTKWGYRIARAATVVGAGALALLTGWHALPVQRGERLLAQPPFIAVMPIVNESVTAADDELADRLTDGIITGLSEVPGVKVISRTSSFRYKGVRIVPRNVARELNGVEALLTGRLRVRDRDVELAVELIDTRDERRLWSRTYTRNAAGLHAAVIEDVVRTLTGKEIAARHARLGEVYEMYLRGRYHWYKRTPEGFERAIAAFTQAIERDPTFAPAYAGLADTYTVMGYFAYLIPFDEARAKARAAAATALALDGSLAEAHTSTASVMEFERWDWAGAERAYRRAIELQPNYATARHWYANNLSLRGRHEEAIAQGVRAVELDPLAPILRVALAHAYLLARREADAIRQLEVALEIEPASPNAHLFLGVAYERQGRFQEALGEMIRANELLENWVWKAFLADLYVRMDRVAEARRIVEAFHARRPVVSRVTTAAIYAAVGERERALRLLERACDARDPDIGFMQSVSAFDGLRREPGFVALLRRAGLG